MHAGHVFLQAGQIIQAWWFPILSLTLDFGDGHAHARHVHDVEQMPCPGLLVDALAGQMPAAHVEDDFPERSGPVALNLPVTSDDHAKGRRLDPADSQAPAVDEPSPSYADSGFISLRACRMAGSSRLATHRRMAGLSTPAW